MVLIGKTRQESFVRQLAQRRDVPRAVLVFGSDGGGVQEMAARLVRALLGEAADDPLALQVLDEETLKDDPGRLADEVQAIPMFGGQRVVQVRGAGKAFQEAVEGILRLERSEAVIVALAPGLRKDAALAKLFSRNPQLAAVPVYADDAGDVQRLIDEVMAAHGLQVERDARLALASLLGGDRMASRNELEKLALYCAGTGRVTLADVQAVCSDVSAHVMQDMLDAFFTGQAARGVQLLQALLAEGVPGAAMLGAAANHVALLKTLRAAMAEGLGAEQAVAQARPPVFFKRRAAVARQLATWRDEALARADESIWQAMQQARRVPVLEAQLAERCLLALALQAARRRAA